MLQIAEMNYTIRRAREEDMTAVHRLIKALAVFENEPDAVKISAEQLKKDGFGKSPLFTCFVAEGATEILGMALVYPRYSTWKGKTIHLEDLMVDEAARGQGIGEALLGEVIRFGAQLGVKRVEWAVLDWNEPAIKFYENVGARVMRDWDIVQMDEEGIKSFLTR